MKLVVKNLGSIKKKSEIDLEKRFYTFVGYNNSGKTYMSQIIWYLFSGFEIAFQLPSNLIIEKEKDKSFEFDISAVLQSFQTALKKNCLDLLGIDDQENIFIEIQRIIHANSFTTPFFSSLDDNIITEYYTFIKSPNSNIVKINLITLESPLTLDEFNRQFAKGFSYNVKLWIHENDHIQNIKRYISKMLFKYIPSAFLIFLPATRSFLPSYYKYLSEGYENEREQIGEIIRKNPNDVERIKFLTKKRHTSAVNQLLNKINGLSSKSEVNPVYLDLVKDLENLMQGSMAVQNVEGIANSEFGFKVNDQTTLEMYQTSTSVSQLTMLYLYFKYWTAEDHNFLIIDEPEENLHPENQIKLLDILVRFANRNNNRVLLTTHSPLMAEAVNNHAHLSLLHEKGEDVAKIISEHHLAITPIDKNDKNPLKHSDYATYFFNGEQIKEYPMTDFGVFFRDFKEAEEKVSDTANILKGYIYNAQKKK